MNNFVIQRVAEVAEIKQAAAYHKQEKPLAVTGLAGSSKPVFFAAMDMLAEEKGSIVIITASREEIRTYRRELNYFYADLPMQELYPISLPRVSADTQSLEVQAGRASALRLMQGAERGIVFITAEAWQQKQLQQSCAMAETMSLTVGQEAEQQNVIERLVKIGYERTEQVDAIGQFCVRGEILDVYPLNSKAPVRIEWFDQEIDAIRSFNIDTQRGLDNLEDIAIAPILLEASDAWTASVFDCCHASTTIFLDEPVHVFATVEKLAKENADYAEDLFSAEALAAQCEATPIVAISALGHNYLKGCPKVNIPVRPIAPYNKNIDLLTKELNNNLKAGITPVIMLTSIYKAKGLAENLHNYGLPGVYAENGITAGSVNVMYGELDHGFRFVKENWELITENDIYGVQKRKRFSSKNSGQKIQYFSDIKSGDYVVHSVYGIGRYVGVEKMLANGIYRDFLLIMYAGNDKLYIPVEHVSMLNKYVGNEGHIPTLTKLGGDHWRRTKAKAYQAITRLAEELLRLYAQRQVIQGHAFAPDGEFQKDFEEAFPFEETEDQIKAIREIKADMEKPQPMDRLLCGDVGYGKTEVAVRAAFKAVMDGKQVALMVPTTVLAQQHYMTIKERMANFGVRIELLNRFVSRKEQRRIIEGVREGQVDMIIATHRLLGQDIQFHDLGLLIIDEEQRFGVAQKEKIKKWCTGIDVLCLSATPIPRTLHMALVNGRDMSVIESPPEDRLPVETYVCEYDDGMIKEALERELRRGGRIYYIYNRINDLDSIAAKLKRLVPGIKVRIAHGQMDENILEDAMIAFFEGECDVLLCTTIVENGLDVPLANTIIVDGADHFGLSQLYQMRGRVGRSSRLAYAYLMYRPDKLLTEVAEKRLQAMRDFTELGAGFKIAMRDLEIRGAGNLLGPEQHGHIAGIGFATYCQMLEETITRLKTGKDLEHEPDPVIEITVDAYIPNEYIQNPRYKLELYRRFADLEYAERDDLLDEIIDRFGNPPEEVMTLWRIATLKGLCRALAIRGVSVQNNSIYITFQEHTRINPEATMKLIDKYHNRIVYKNGKEPQLILKTTGLKQEPLAWLEENLPQLAQ